MGVHYPCWHQSNKQVMISKDARKLPMHSHQTRRRITGTYTRIESCMKVRSRRAPLQGKPGNEVEILGTQEA